MAISSGTGPIPVTGQGTRRRARGGYRPESGFNPLAIVFLAPALLLLAVFHVYPTIYTFILSFFRGRSGELNGFLGLRNYEQLFFRDPNFIRFSNPSLDPVNAVLALIVIGSLIAIAVLAIRQRRQKVRDPIRMRVLMLLGIGIVALTAIYRPSGALWNNVLWVVFYTSVVLFLGLIIAVLASRVRYEALIKGIVFLPMAIAATALAIIWRFVYSPDADIGLLNAILAPAGVGPVAFLGDPAIVNWALIAAGIWGSVGFATVILSAALKGIPGEIIEAARVDGASERQIFLRIIVPMVSLPLSVLAVTLIVNVVKLFDLIFVMTQGGPGTASRVIAFSMYQEAFPGGLFGKGAAVAVIMLLLLIPIMIYNVRRFRTEAVT